MGRRFSVYEADVKLWGPLNRDATLRDILVSLKERTAGGCYNVLVAQARVEPVASGRRRPKINDA